jgi:hypothetical protein
MFAVLQKKGTFAHVFHGIRFKVRKRLVVVRQSIFSFIGVYLRFFTTPTLPIPYRQTNRYCGNYPSTSMSRTG